MDGSKFTMEKSSLKKLVTSLFCSSPSSTCGISSCNISDVELPMFVPSSHHHHHFHKIRPNNHLPPPPPPHLPFQPTPAVSVDCHSCRPTRPRKKNPAPESEAEKRKPKNAIMATKKKKKNGKLLSNGYGFTSCSSGDSDGGGAAFSSEDESNKQVKEETEILVSSKSFSSDSSEFYNKSSKSKNTRKKKEDDVASSTQRRRPPRRTKEFAGNEGLAVVKQSSDPYGDFRSSVLEMMVENQIVGAKELEQLLRSYLALNSRSHHPIILQVFSDVWETLFSN